MKRIFLLFYTVCFFNINGIASDIYRYFDIHKFISAEPDLHGLIYLKSEFDRNLFLDIKEKFEGQLRHYLDVSKNKGQTLQENLNDLEFFFSVDMGFSEMWQIINGKQSWFYIKINDTFPFIALVRIAEESESCITFTIELTKITNTNYENYKNEQIKTGRSNVFAKIAFVDDGIFIIPHELKDNPFWERGLNNNFKEYIMSKAHFLIKSTTKIRFSIHSKAFVPKRRR